MKRFLSKIKVVENGCHEWQSTLNKQGYGKFWFEGKQVPAHRMAYELLIGEIPKGMCVCHHCDNPKCVNPDHLFVGTHADNFQDMLSKGRQWGNRKLSTEAVGEILTLIQLGKYSQQSIAERYGISQITVSRLKLRQRHYLKFMS